MSTRSGKRIHNSLLEDTGPTKLEQLDHAVKSERKTRSKRVKDNLDELSVSLFKNKKRNNYVSYPTDDELLGDTAAKQHDETKRPLRKNAFKEHNFVDDSENSEANTKNLIRKSRRGKRLDDAEETENHENVPAEITELPKSKKSKKKKKVGAAIDNLPPVEEAPVKKSKKKKNKGKKTSSIIVEDIPQHDISRNSALNKSNMSIDSFHSAAGSPDHIHDDVNKEHVNKLNSTFEKNETEAINNSSSRANKNINNNTFDRSNTSKNMILDKDDKNKNSPFDKTVKKRKSVSKETTFDKCYVSVTRDNLKKDLQRINDSNWSNAQFKQESNTKDSTFDKSNITSNDLEKDNESNLNVSNVSQKLPRRRKSSVKDVSKTENISVEDTKNNETFDKGMRRRSSVVKDVTFDKSNASITRDIVSKDTEIDLNLSNISNKKMNTRKCILKDSTFDKSNASITIVDKHAEIDLNASNTSKKHMKTRKSILKDSTFDKSNASITKDDANIEDINLNVLKKQMKTRQSLVKETIFDNSNASITNVNNDLSVSTNKKLKRSTSNIKDSTFDKPEPNINTTFDKETKTIQKENKKDSTFDKSDSKNLNATYEKDLESDSTVTLAVTGKDNKSSVNTTYDKTDKSNDTTFEKDISTSFDAFKKGAMTRKSSIRDSTFEKSNTSFASLTKEDFEKCENIISSSATKRRSLRRHTIDNIDIITKDIVNTTYEKPGTEKEPKRKSPRHSQSSAIQIQLNTTFEKENNEKENSSESKSSLISSDNSVTDKSDISRISITSDDTTENIVNTTPLLIESSMDESHVSVTKPESPKPQTPLKREGTFTKDSPKVTQPEIGSETPSKRKSLPVPAAGCTPYHVTKSSQKKIMFNVTRSIEKTNCASVDPAPRLTKVMFCSPVDNPVAVTTEKRKIIKSNLKGSNKSFVFEETASISRPARKRSYTQSDADDARVKRTRLTEDLQQSVDRLSRPRTNSATAKLSVVTPKKPLTPSKPKSEAKVSRTKLPNFAAVHQKNFAKMESLDECQERRAKRAKQLLTPTAPPGLLERISPTNNADSPKGKGKEVATAKPKEKSDTPTKKLPTLESLRPGFTRFGFKLNMDVNPFSIPSKTEKPKEKPAAKPVEKSNGLQPRQGVLPSLAGATSLRRELAKSTIMREKSFTDKRNVKRNENRTIIKGVRTNRRFELQMKLRNID